MGARCRHRQPDGVEKLLAAANTSSTRAQAAWITLLSLGVYLAVTVGTTTHKQLILEGPVKLPFLGVDLPLFSFYWVAPGVFLLLHLYVLIQLYLLARSLHLFEQEMQKRVALPAREHFRARLDPFLFTQMLAGRQRSLVASWVINLTIWITLVLAPVVLLLGFQVRFLPYHDVAITWWHRSVVLLDLAFLWMLWPAIVHPGGATGRAFIDLAMAPVRLARVMIGEIRHASRHLQNLFSRRAWLAAGSSIWELQLSLLHRTGTAVFPLLTIFYLALFSAAVAGFSVLVATIPQEKTEVWLLSQAWLPGKNKPSTVWYPTRVLFEGTAYLRESNVDKIGGGPKSVFARNLVLPAADFVDDGFLEKVETTINLRGRDLRYAMLPNADLRKADLTSADLSRAFLRGAKLNEAMLDGASLQYAYLFQSQLDGASLKGARVQCAHLTGVELDSATLDDAQLDGSILQGARLRGATLTSASLVDTDLRDADLLGANLSSAQLQGANLRGARLVGADLFLAHLDAADLENASLQGADLRGAQLQFSNLNRASLQGSELGSASASGEFLGHALTFRSSFAGVSLNGAALWRSKFTDDRTFDSDFFLSDISDVSFSPIGRKDLENLVHSMDGANDQKTRHRVLTRLSALLDSSHELDMQSKVQWNKLLNMKAYDSEYEHAITANLADSLCNSDSFMMIIKRLRLLYDDVDWRSRWHIYADITAERLKRPDCAGAKLMLKGEKQAPGTKNRPRAGCLIKERV